MSVLACNRMYCENIMCEVYVYEIDSCLCNDCIAEFIGKYGDRHFTVEELIIKLQKFINRAKRVKGGSKGITAQDFFNKVKRR